MADLKDSGDWAADFDAHRRGQLRRAARLPFALKLEWLEDIQALGAQFGARRPDELRRPQERDRDPKLPGSA
jgi:hypothetical protein